MADGSVSPFYFFSHRQPFGVYNFVTLQTISHNLTLSRSHYVYTDVRLIAASTVTTAHRLELSNSRFARVLRIFRTSSRGLYNPHTISSELLVGGVRVSVYTYGLLNQLLPMLYSLCSDVCFRRLHGMFRSVCFQKRHPDFCVE